MPLAREYISTGNQFRSTWSGLTLRKIKMLLDK